jgi:hypothetical protein
MILVHPCVIVRDSGRSGTSRNFGYAVLLSNGGAYRIARFRGQ